MKIHKSLDDLPDYIPKEIIPKEYGGSGDTIANSIGKMFSLTILDSIIICETMSIIHRRLVNEQLCNHV